jgi:hypothetical protein
MRFLINTVGSQFVWDAAVLFVKTVAILFAVELIRRALAHFNERQRPRRPQISGPIHVRLMNP